MDKLDQCDDATLLDARERADDAFSIFYRRHVDAVLRLCARRGLRAADAADATAETFLAALEARTRYRPQGDSARAWLFCFAEHKIAERSRRSWRDRRLLDRLALEPIALTERDYADYAELLAAETESIASDALDALPDAQRAAVYARVVSGDEYDAIAQRLHITETLARKRVSRGLAALRARIGKN
jgi:RNA polymerase sigma factor (sigma-70 family)